MMNKHEHIQNYKAKNKFDEIKFSFVKYIFIFYQQELRQEFEIEKANLFAQWKNEVNLSKNEQNEINEQLNELKENYLKQVLFLFLFFFCFVLNLFN